MPRTKRLKISVIRWQGIAPLHDFLECFIDLFPSQLSQSLFGLERAVSGSTTVEMGQIMSQDPVYFYVMAHQGCGHEMAHIDQGLQVIPVMGHSRPERCASDLILPLFC